jgi:hypothetical protein
MKNRSSLSKAAMMMAAAAGVSGELSAAFWVPFKSQEGELPGDL